MRINNPCCIRLTKGTPWLGQTENPREKTFVTFTERVYGYRAAFLLLRKYIDRGYDTIGKIIRRWAPACENDTQAYINFVSRTVGMEADKHIGRDDRDTLLEMVRSMAAMESGIIEDKELLASAWTLATF